MDTETSEQRQYHVPLKTYRAALVSLVDEDYLPGVYQLQAINLETTGGYPVYPEDIPEDPEGGPIEFRIDELQYEYVVRSLSARLLDPPLDQ